MLLLLFWITRILISNVQGNNVFLISISRDARNRVNFEMYVALYNGTFLLLNRQDLYQAVQVSYYTVMAPSMEKLRPCIQGVQRFPSDGGKNNVLHGVILWL